MIEVFGHKVMPGQKAYFTVDGPKYANQAVSQIPVIVLCGAGEGATLWLTGAVHGHEVTGSQGMWEMANELDPKDLSGNIIMTPVVNVAAFCERRMKSYFDDFSNMDAIFPGSPDGAFSSRLANILFEEIKAHADLLISFHCFTPMGEGLPYTIVKSVKSASPEVNAAAQKYQKAIGFAINCVVETADNDGSIDGCCIANGIPAFVTELGRGAQITREMIDVSKYAIRNILVAMSILPAAKPETFPRQIVITDREFMRIDQGGFMSMSVKAGDIVPAGGEIAQVHYFGKEVHSFKTSRRCIVLFTHICPAVNDGDFVAMVGYEWHDCK